MYIKHFSQDPISVPLAAPYTPVCRHIRGWPSLWPIWSHLEHTDATFPAYSCSLATFLKWSQTGFGRTATQLQESSGLSRIPQWCAEKSRLPWLETGLPSQPHVSLVLKNTSAHCLDIQHGHASGILNFTIPVSKHCIVLSQQLPLNLLPKDSTTLL